MSLAETLAAQLDGSRDWTLKLIVDFGGDDWTFQPAVGMGHALWLCGHLATAEDSLINVRCLGTSGLLGADFRQHFPIGQPVKSATDHEYPPPDEIAKTMAEVHEQTCAGVRSMSDSLLAEPALGPDGKTPHPHYHDKCGAVSHVSRHEAFHAGQLATIRRMLGKPFLR